MDQKHQKLQQAVWQARQNNNAEGLALVQTDTRRFLGEEYITEEYITEHYWTPPIYVSKFDLVTKHRSKSKPPESVISYFLYSSVFAFLPWMKDALKANMAFSVSRAPELPEHMISVTFPCYAG